MAKLAAYRAKRNFGTTAEPRGDDDPATGSAFVVQKHAASRLHYDLRLELDGVMKSWAVAKGPSLVPGEKRLAVHVEDHPIEYNTFEGTIPQGQYGGGTVMIWDRGRWDPGADPRRGYAKGHLDFRLEGEKLGGAWHLVRMRQRPREKQEAWLLIKSDDEFARPAEAADILEEKPLSVVSGRDLDQIASAEDGAVWNSNRAEAPTAIAPPERPARRVNTSPPHAEVARAAGPRSTRDRRTSFEAPLRGAPQDEEARRLRSGAEDGRAKVAKKARSPASTRALSGRSENRAPAGPASPMPKEIEPCLATLVAEVPGTDRWLHEIKWDGYRLIAFKSGDKVRLATRRGLDWTTRFPAIAEAVRAVPAERAILDGEAIIEDQNGVSNFSALQNALSDEHGRIARNAVFMAFDLLYLDGEDLRPLALDDRKARLSALLEAGPQPHLKASEHIVGEGSAMVRSACGLGLEGVISKRRDRPYRSGRGDDWLKTKCTERQEFVICGFVPSTATRRAIGSLVLGYHEGGVLRHAGRAGTGYTAEVSRDLWRRLDAIKAKAAPFPERLAAEERRGVVWTEPRLVAEIEFRGWTGDARLRHAAFKGLREDKLADEIVRERPVRVEGAAASAPKALPQPSPRVGRDDEVAGVRLSHPDRVLWPQAGVTKQGLAEFYEEIADWLLPHVVHRPLSLVRCPSGPAGGCFFQKHSWAGLGDDIRRETVRDEGGEEEVLYVEDIRGIVSLVQAGVLEIHPWGSTIADIDRPDRITIDLDPAEDVAWPRVIEAAQEVRSRLSAQKLESFVKTTGGKGVHVVVPLDARAGWPETKAFAKSLAEAMEADTPSRFIAKASKQARRGLIYVDYLRNGRGATAIAAYSTRARPGATVSVPIGWDELTPALRPDHFDVMNLPARLGGLRDDPWGDLVRVKQTLPGSRNPRKSPRSKSPAAG